jgi:RHS repeat-associated protein
MPLTRNTYQRNSSWNAPYTFSGKEKDAETGYGYFGARYYDSGLSIWLSVDPMSDKYPSMSPYNYCANNPVMLVDPDGRFVIITGAQAMAAFASLQQATNLKLKINSDGKVEIDTDTDGGGRILNENDQKLYDAIKSEDKIVNIDADPSHTDNPGGGANMGTKKLNNGTVKSTMHVNTDLLKAFETNSSAPTGSGILHEVLEGYESAYYTKETNDIIKPNWKKPVYTPDVQLINGVETDVLVLSYEPVDPANDAKFTLVHKKSSYMPDFGSRYSRKIKKDWLQPSTKPGFTPRY